MRTLRTWILCLLLPLLAPLAWGGWVQVASPTQAAMPCHMSGQDMRSVEKGNRGTPENKHVRCGDCSACHVLALLPSDWQLNGPALVQAAPGWYAASDRGRPKACELYRPPRA